MNLGRETASLEQRRGELHQRHAFDGRAMTNNPDLERACGVAEKAYDIHFASGCHERRGYQKNASPAPTVSITVFVKAGMCTTPFSGL